MMINKRLFITLFKFNLFIILNILCNYILHNNFKYSIGNEGKLAHTKPSVWYGYGKFKILVLAQ